MRIALGCCAALLVTLIASPTPVSAQLVLYDDFDAEFIDVNKWTPVETPRGLAGEAVREIHGRPGTRRLHMIYRAYGDLGSDVGNTGGRNRLVFANSALVSAIEATVAVN